MIASSRSAIFCLLFTLLVASTAFGQIHSPVKWTFNATADSGSEATLYFTANLESGWHTYSQFLEDGGPLPTAFKLSPSEDYTLVGNIKEESTPIKSYDSTFLMPIVSFERTAVFSQHVILHTTATIIKGTVEFMVCKEDLCLPPDELSFSIEVTVSKPLKKDEPRKQDSGKSKKKNPTPNNEFEGKLGKTEILKSQNEIDHSLNTSPLGGTTRKSQNKVKAFVPVVSTEKDHPTIPGSLWSIFILGFVGGLAAILMPCIFPMIPFTVGYFAKRHSSKAGSVRMALLYGLSIIVIYVSLSIIITMLFGSDALNEISTNGAFNFLFFMLLVIFAASFLGAFEITLPSSWSNKADAQSDRKGFAGIFFMAATLALVSFSCTGPLIGTLLVTSYKMGSIFPGPVLGMLGFSLALALPFTLFAMFPGWLKVLPKSGGWLNSMKVVLGFLELALALKFLSNVDLAYHWEWFDREVFLVLWITIFGLLGFYLLGKIRLPHDSDLKHLSPVRLLFSVVTLAFTLYMVPGLWGAPLKAIAAFLPPQQTQDFDLFTDNGKFKSDADGNKKYATLFKAPHNLNAFFDYEEGLAYARKVKKPVMIDFTGHACVNCRRMETTIWPDPRILSHLQNDFVVVQLYVDDKTELPGSEQKISDFSGKRIKTIGNKWSDLQATSFNTNSQPYYVLLSPDGRKLATPIGVDDADSFARFLSDGLENFENSEHIY